MKFNLQQKEMPAWYELGLTGDGNGFALSIHEKAFKYLLGLGLENHRLIPYFQGLTRLDPMTPLCVGDWGFGHAMRLVPDPRPDWLSWHIAFPDIRGGDGTNSANVRVSLKILSSGLWLFDGDTGWHEPQLTMIEDIRIDRGHNGGSLGVSVSPAVATWVSKHINDSTIQPIVDAMKIAHLAMWDEDLSCMRFSAYKTKPKYLSLSVPGDACYIGPSTVDHNSMTLEGYGLDPHNVDNGLQQLTLLAGTAKLHDLVREAV